MGWGLSPLLPCGALLPPQQVLLPGPLQQQPAPQPQNLPDPSTSGHAPSPPRPPSAAGVAPQAGVAGGEHPTLRDITECTNVNKSAHWRITECQALMPSDLENASHLVSPAMPGSNQGCRRTSGFPFLLRGQLESRGPQTRYRDMSDDQQSLMRRVAHRTHWLKMRRACCSSNIVSLQSQFWNDMQTACPFLSEQVWEARGRTLKTLPHPGNSRISTVPLIIA